MARLENYEKLERVLFQSGMFAVKNVVLLGQKSPTTGGRLNPLYQRSYASTKYTDRNQLSQMVARTSDFLVFSYSNYDTVTKENKGIDIYASFPHMLDVIDFFKELDELGNTEGVYSNTGVTPNYADILVESEELGGGKRLRAIPNMIEDKDGNLRPGFILFFNDEDKFVNIDLKSIFTLLYILDKIDLLTLSNQTIIMGLLFDSNPSVASSTPVQNTSFESSGRTGMFANKNRRSTFSGRTTRTTSTSNVASNNQVQQNNVVEETPVQQVVEDETPVQQTRREVPQSSNKTSISMGDIMSTASEINIYDEEEIDI